MRSFCRMLLMGLLAAISLPAQTATTLNLSTDLVRLGIASGNMVPNQPALDAGPLLESGVRYAVRNNFTRVVADAGAYYFLSASTASSVGHAAFSGPTTTPLTIDLQGADLYFAKTGLVGLFVTGGTNLTLQNFTVDYVQQPYTQATITSVNAASRQLQFTVQPGWQPVTALNALFTSGAVTPHVYVFRNGQPWASFIDLASVTPYVDGSVTLGATVPAATLAGIRPGDVAVIEARVGGNGILASALTGSTLRNIKIYSGGSGIRTVRCASCLFEHIEIVPRPGTDRLISTVADGFQPQQPGLNNTIRLCRSIRTCDDGFSPVVYVYGSVQSVTGARSVQIQGDAATSLAASYPLPNGSNVVFERAADGVIVASAVLVSQTTAPAVGGVAQMSLTFDRDLPAGLQGTWLYSTDASWRGGGMLFERNTVQQQGSFRGVSVWGLMNLTMSGNYIYRASSAAIDIVHQLRVGDWIVPPSVNLTMSNNVIDGANTAGGQNNAINLGGIESRATNDRQATMPASLHQNLTLTSNVVANPGRAAVWVGGTNGAVADNNYFYQPNDSAALAVGNAWATAAQSAQPLVSDNSVNVTVGTNVIDKASRRVFVTDLAYRELAAYAPGATVRLSAWNLGAIVSPAASLKDADGTIWPLSMGMSTHALDVLLPPKVGLGGAVITVTGTGVSYFGTLFVDSQDNVPSINATVFNISPATLRVAADGGVASFLVTATTGAAYQVTTTAAFVTLGAASGAGTGTVNATLARNTGAARSAVIEIAGQPFTVAQAGAADPVIVTQPQTQAATSGAAATFFVTATGAQSYQWLLNGAAISGATASTYTVTGGTAAQAGTYTVVATSGANSATSSGALLTFSGAPAISRLLNLSILTSLTPEDPGFTVGTVIGGPGTAGSKPLLVRAAGPALAVFGIDGALPDPQLELFSGESSIATNDNWGGTAALTTAFTAVGAFNYAGAASKDAAIFNPGLAAGGYTVQVRGVAGATGRVIAELYDSTPGGQFTALTPRLINVSVLKQINTGDVLIAGFVISGSAPKQVLIRAVGPTLGLAPFNIGTAMSDPKLQLYSGQDVTASNDNWGIPVGSAATAAQLSAAFTAVGAFALPAGSKDAALLVTLAPGAYTAQVSAVQAGGVAIVEVYDVP